MFVIKRNQQGDIERYKARLTVRGFEQVFGLDFYEIYAPVISMEAIRVIFMLTLINILSHRFYYCFSESNYGSQSLHGATRNRSTMVRDAFAYCRKFIRAETSYTDLERNFEKISA